MIKYKVTQVIGKKNRIEENESKYFGDLDSAIKYFRSVDIFDEMIKAWDESSYIVRMIQKKEIAFLGYDLIEYDTDDAFYKIILGTKTMSFKIDFEELKKRRQK